MPEAPNGVELRLVREMVELQRETSSQLSEVNSRLAVLETSNKGILWICRLLIGGVISAVLGAVMFAVGIGPGSSPS